MKLETSDAFTLRNISALLFLSCSFVLRADSPPPQAAGYSLNFSDEFDALDLSLDGTGNHAWYNGVWFYKRPAPASSISAANSELSLVWDQSQTPNDTSVETFAFKNSNYRAWRYGYFEVRMKWDPVVGAWPAIWMTPVETALGQDFYNGVQEQGEFDIFEGQGSQAHTFFGTIHDWKNGASTANTNNYWNLGSSVDFSQYHKYGLLWVPGKVTWYFDDQPLMSAPTPGVVDKQTYLLILGMQEGANWQYGNKTGVAATTMKMTVDWVRVWQLTTSPAPVATPQTLGTPYLTPLPITLSGSDAGSKALTYAIVTNPAHGSLTGTAPNVTYLPSAGFTGADSFTFKVNNGTADSAPATVAISVGAQPPSISPAPGAVSFATIQGVNPASQSVSLTNSGGGTLGWSASSGASWLSVSPASGSLVSGGSAALQVSVNAAGLSAGSYSANVTVAGAGAVNSPQTVLVSLTVSAPLIPAISVAPASLGFSATVGQNPAAQTVGLTNSGNAALNWTVTSSASWLSAAPAGGSVGAGGNALVQASIDTAGLAAGTYSGSLSFAGAGAANSPQSAGVTLVVAQAHKAILSVTPLGLAFTAVAGQSPGIQTLTISNLRNAPVNWSAASGASWLSVSPANGTLAASANTVLQVAVDGRSLNSNAGGYAGVLTFADAGAANSPQTVGVAVSVTSGAPTAAPLQFVGMTPCRVVDTRWVDGPSGGPELAVGKRDFAIANGPCGVPASAAAYALNVTVVPDGPLGYLSIWPAGQPQPVVSTLNSDGRIKANAAIVPSGANSSVSVFATQPTHLVMDVTGYFVPAGSNGAGLSFYPITPCRLADTRGPVGVFGGPYLSGGSPRAFPVFGSRCNIPGDAQAYSLNLTVVPRGPLGYLTAWPSGQPQPAVSTLNANSGTVTANAAVVQGGGDGGVSIYGSNDTDLVIDINGYFAPPGNGGLSLYTLTPCRVLDTRWAAGSPGIDGMKATSLPDSGCNVPRSAKAFVLNTTVAPPGPLGYLTIWPDGQDRPLVSTLNADPGTVTSNMAIVPTVNGAVDVFGSNRTHVVLDVSSYFAP